MIRIDTSSQVPLEDQIVSSLRRALARGEVRAGETLPSVRQLAGDLGVHWNTVARSYRRLAEDGLLTVRRGRGAVVRGTPVRGPRGELKALMAEAITAGRLGGLAPREIAAAFEEELRRWPKTSIDEVGP